MSLEEVYCNCATVAMKKVMQLHSTLLKEILGINYGKLLAKIALMGILLVLLFNNKSCGMRLIASCHMLSSYGKMNKIAYIFIFLLLASRAVPVVGQARHLRERPAARFARPPAALFFQIRAVHPNCGPVTDNRVVHMVMAQAEIAPGGKMLRLGHAHAV